MFSADGDGAVGQLGQMTGFFRIKTISALAAACLGIASCKDRAVASEIALTCTAAAGIAAEKAELVCQEFTLSLQKAYPELIFSNGGAGLAGQLQVHIHNATASALGLGLVWTDADGNTVRGEVKSVSAMDRTLDAGRRAALYRRVIAATPIPD